MTNHKATKKSVRKDAVRRVENRSKIRTMKTFRSKFEEAIAKVGSGATTTEDVESAFRKAQSLIARAGRKNLIPSGRADRIISRMNLSKNKAAA